MTKSREEQIEEIKKAATEVLKLLGNLENLASEADFGVEFSSTEITFNDWQSSDCYGEGNSDTFGVYSDGSVWETSSC